jgi:signal transduction histidine kinase
MILDEALKTSEERRLHQSVTVLRDYGNAAVVRVDKSLLHEAVERLIANALDAMPDGGTLTLLTDQEIVNGVPYVRVRIQDTGEGIPAEKMEKIFEPFFTTRTSRKGTGPSLPIAKNIVEEGGGVIRIASTEMTGTTVTLLFPDLRAA